MEPRSQSPHVRSRSSRPVRLRQRDRLGASRRLTGSSSRALASHRGGQRASGHAHPGLPDILSPGGTGRGDAAPAGVGAGPPSREEAPAPVSARRGTKRESGASRDGSWKRTATRSSRRGTAARRTRSGTASPPARSDPTVGGADSDAHHGERGPRPRGEPLQCAFARGQAALLDVRVFRHSARSRRNPPPAGGGSIDRSPLAPGRGAERARAAQAPRRAR